MYLKDVGWEGVGCVQFIRNRDLWRALIDRLIIVEFVVLTEVVRKNSISWDLTP
jgi:hypothetical protein